MSDPRTARFFADALAGRLSRRQALSFGLRLGITSPVLAAALAAAPAAAVPPVPEAHRLPSRQEGSGTLTILLPSGFSDLDPQAAYDNTCSMFFMAT